MRPVCSNPCANVHPSTSYPTLEGEFLSTLSHGVAATEKTDDSGESLPCAEFLPAGKTLTLPPPADGKFFLTAKLLANGNTVQLMQSPAGVSLTLGTQDTWNSTDTVIGLTVAPQSRPPRNLALHAAVSSSSSLQMGGGLASAVPWGGSDWSTAGAPPKRFRRRGPCRSMDGPAPPLPPALPNGCRSISA